MTGPVANQWTGFYMKTASVMKELKAERCSYLFNSLRYKYFSNAMKNFANFIGKHMQGSPILRKAAGMGLQLYKKPYKNTTCILR